MNSDLKNYGQISPIECYKLNSISLISLIFFIFSISSNSFLLWIFLSNKELRSPISIIIIVITFQNLFGSFTEFPIMIINNYSCRWMFGKIMCTVSGFLMYFIGCSSIYLLSAISFERWYVIMNPFKFRIFTRKSIIIMIIACELFSLFWCLAPLFGWSYYSMEISLTTCSIEWYENSFNVKSYNTVIFMLVYFIPLVFLIFTNCKIVFMIRSLNGFLKNSGEKFFSKKRVIKERKLTISILLVIIGFMISWTPYAVVSLIAVFFSEYIEISPMMSLMPAIFAKTSLFWPSALYIFSNRQIQVILAKKMSAFTKRKATSDIYMTTMNQLTRTSKKTKEQFV